MTDVTDAPAEHGFRMPAELERHDATWIAWPHEKTDWPGKFSAIPWAYAEIVRHLARVERVFLLVQSRAEQMAVRSILKQSGVNLVICAGRIRGREAHLPAIRV